MLAHICCSVDSHYFLQRLREDFKDEAIFGFFYNPNIHPFSEYSLRLFDVNRSCKKLDITLIDGEYDLISWLNATKGLESEPEKGKRCGVCFESRLEATCKKALEIGEKKITTTLLTSPKKSLEKLKEVGEAIANRYGLEFITIDYRSNGGTQRQFELAKQDNLYKQNYCGCLYALKMQRESAFELMNPINRAILPNSIESKIELFKRVSQLEEQKIEFKITKNRILNYRLLSAKILLDSKVIDSYFLSYSTNRKKYIKTKIDFIFNNIAYLKQDEVKLVSLKSFNRAMNLNFESVKELYFNPINLEDELKFREELTGFKFDTSTIIILDEIVDRKYEIFIDSLIFEDVVSKVEEILLVSN